MAELYIDESVSPAITRGLRRRGIDAVDVRDEGRIGMTDTEQLEHAEEHGLAIFTHDDDFIHLVEQEKQHPGVIYCDQRKYTIGGIIRTLEAFLETTQEEDLQNTVHYL